MQTVTPPCKSLQLSDLTNRVLTFLRNLNPKICSVATVSAEGMPNCAVMGYAVLPDLRIVLNTHVNTRKWRNLTNNPLAALTFGWSMSDLYLQYEGRSELIPSGSEHLKCEALYFAEHPDAIKYQGLGDVGTIRITPTWLRLYNLATEPETIDEFRPTPTGLKEVPILLHDKSAF